mmetsp:Transcript_89239/g.251159  ORF Transcript_89239/g.251159 Transcript_89239/m.251159 type:complete len:235 (-) Transcript_89239:133-837(-)
MVQQHAAYVAVAAKRGAMQCGAAARVRRASSGEARAIKQGAASLCASGALRGEVERGVPEDADGVLLGEAPVRRKGLTDIGVTTGRGIMQRGVAVHVPRVRLHETCAAEQCSTHSHEAASCCQMERCAPLLVARVDVVWRSALDGGEGRGLVALGDGLEQPGEIVEKAVPAALHLGGEEQADCIAEEHGDLGQLVKRLPAHGASRRISMPHARREARPVEGVAARRRHRIQQGT